MDADQIELLERDLDALVAELEEERFRHVAGLEPAPALAGLFLPRSRAAHRETVAALRAAGNGELAGRVAALRAERAQAEDEEGWRAAESAAEGLGPDGAVPLATAERALLRERDRGRRLAFGRAAAEAAARASPRREAATEARARARAEGGLVPDWRMVVEGDQVLEVSADGWRDVVAWAADRELGLAPRPRGDLARADLLHLLALPRWDGLFPPGALEVSLKLTLERLGLDLGRIRIDAGERPAKWPGVHVQGARVSLGRRGGAGDWLDLFRGAGAALAAARHPPHARDPVFAEALGALLSGLLLEPRFLAERLGADRKSARDLVRELSLRELFRLRARAAALRVATEVERGLTGAAWREAHREALSAAALAAWDGAFASRDADAPALAASLAGAAAAVRLREEIRERLDEDWWRNPRSAAHLAGLLVAGRLGPGEAAPSPREAARALVDRL
ncbi:MAG TPA: hypothetical protein VLS93_09955 [Anaeromyxobacteraceae bacterium]|nr:hypothetical protein [Anaeromyxobacteraceae bacterium]